MIEWLKLSQAGCILAYHLCCILPGEMRLLKWSTGVCPRTGKATGRFVYTCLDTCCSHFLTIIAGVDLHFRHESELPV